MAAGERDKQKNLTWRSDYGERKTTRGVVETLHTPVVETSAVDSGADVRPRD